MVNAQAQENDKVITDYMESAARDAVYTAHMTGDTAFGSHVERNNSLTRFYDTLFASFNAHMTEGNKGLVRSSVPCVLLIDNDGVYVNTHGQRNDDGEYTTTPIYAYSRRYVISATIYYIQYYLNDFITVRDWDGKTLYTGTYKDVSRSIRDNEVLLAQLKALDSNGDEGEIFGDEELYLKEKQDVVSQTVQDTVNYYLNTQNQAGNNKHGNVYDVTIPDITSNYGKSITSPTVIAFFQEEQIPSLFNKHTNGYVMAGGELYVSPKYYITSDDDGLKYHMANCSDIEGKEFDKAYDSMWQCAQLGAYPCHTCIH